MKTIWLVNNEHVLKMIFCGVIFVVLIMSLFGCTVSKDTQGSNSESPGFKISGDARIRAGEIYH